MVGALQLEVFPDVVPFLSYLRNRGVRTAVVSDWDCTLVEHLSRLGIRAWVDDVVVSADVGVTKPDPRIFDRALRVLDVAAGHAVHCGDDPRRDVLGAAASGIRPVLVDREHRYPEAPGRVSSLDELIGAI
jgi:putative hydrolase of the HAD superfamily